MSEHYNDWKGYVRDNLLPRGLTAEREMEIIDRAQVRIGRVEARS
jgi:hypothetical protein